MLKAIPSIRLLLLFTLIVYFKVDVFSQSYASISVKQDPTKGQSQKSLSDVLGKLHVDYRINFNYNEKLVEGKVVDMTKFSSENAGGIEKILHTLLSPFNLSFEKVGDNTYVIYADRKLEEGDKKSFNGFKKTKEITVKGKVTDEGNGEGLPGVSIVLKETTIGTVTGIDGSYSISLPEENNGILVFSFIGYETAEVPLDGRSVVDVVLMPSLETLSEVVVIGYGSQQKKDLTGSVATIDPKATSSLPVASVGDQMQGRAAGVQILQSGSPGSDPTFVIRGLSTVNDNNPLFVIDGVPVSSGLNTLNPNDIESIQVLKDASAAAIYGSRGANGVIIVTTKRGKGEKGTFSVNGFSAIQQPIQMVEMLDASQFAALNNEMLANNNQATNPDYADPASLGKGTDWLDAYFRTAPMNNISVSYSGSSEKSNYHVSGNYLNQEGIVINTGFQRYSLQINSDHQVLKRLKFGNNLTLNHDIKGGGTDIPNVMSSLPVQPVLNPDGTYSGPVGDNPLWYGGINNPIGLSNVNTHQTKGYNLIGGIYGEVRILEGLNFKSNVGLQANFWGDRTWVPKYNWQPNPQTQAFLSQSSNKNLTWLFDNTLTYDKLINDVHKITLLAGTSAQRNRRDWIGATARDFASETTQQISNGNPTLSTTYGSYEEWSLFSYFGRLNYGFKDKYLITATVRRDGSSRFGPKNKFGTFPSVSAAWRVSEEGFLSGVELLNDLKIRAGYGLTGNQSIGLYTYAPTLNSGTYNFNGTAVNTVFPLRMSNPAVKWETVHQTNIGLDATFINNRITLNVDVFLKNTEGMQVRMNVPVSTGYNESIDNRPYINAGKMENKGIEIGLSTINTEGALEWNTNFNMTFVKNKIVDLNDTVPISDGQYGLNSFIVRQQAGQPYNSFYGYVVDGIFQSDEEVANSARQVEGTDAANRTSAGDIRFKDLNSDGIIDEKDRTFIGNPNPEFYLAMNNSFAYKGIDLSIFLQGVYGNDIYNVTRVDREGMAAVQNQTVAVLNRWQSVEQPGDGKMPRAVLGDPNKNTRESNRYIEDGSYLRIKNITLGYTLPKSITRNFIASLRIYASVQNLYTLTNYSGFDPEVGVNGRDLNVYPVTRTFSGGINLNF